jgi:hypothetical protein
MSSKIWQRVKMYSQASFELIYLTLLDDIGACGFLVEMT